VLHLGEFLAAGDTKAEILQIITPIGMQHKAMMPVVHAQVTTITLAFL
jgi:hypothetical protein